MSRQTKAIAILVLVLLCGLARGESATAVTKTTKAVKKVATTKKKATTTKKRPSTTVRVTTTTPAPAPTALSATSTAPTPPSTAAITTAAPPVPAAGGITVQNFSFPNSPITAKVGGAVVITNLDSADHTVTADDGSFSEAIGGNKTASFTVSKPGTFPFRCNIHPTMKGTLTVT